MINFFRKLFSRDYHMFGSLRSPLWSKWSKDIIKKRGGRCEATGVTRDLNLHHIVPYHIDPSKELDEDNVIVLTRDIHFWLAHLGSWSSWEENIVEHSKELRERIERRP